MSAPAASLITMSATSTDRIIAKIATLATLCQTPIPASPKTVIAIMVRPCRQGSAVDSLINAKIVLLVIIWLLTVLAFRTIAIVIMAVLPPAQLVGPTDYRAALRVMSSTTRIPTTEVRKWSAYQTTAIARTV